MSAKIKNRGHSKHKNSPRPKGTSQHDFHKVYWPYIPLVLFIFGLSVLGLKSGAFSQGLRHPSGEVLAYSTSMEPAKLLADSNSQRQSNDEPLLSLDGQLQSAAQAKANDMAARGYWSHVTADGTQPWVFITAKGYQYQKAGENLAAGFSNEQSVVSAWMASAAHRHNLLDPAYKDVGFGVANILDYKAAGGGPMSVVVAFYGDPVGAVDQQLVANSDPGAASFSSDSSNSSGLDLGKTSTRANLSLASYHLYGLASVSILIIMGSALIVWASRHILVLKKVIVNGESFVFNHPLVDVGLLIVATLAFLLNQTVGFIK